MFSESLSQILSYESQYRKFEILYDYKTKKYIELSKGSRDQEKREILTSLRFKPVSPKSLENIRLIVATEIKYFRSRYNAPEMRLESLERLRLVYSILSAWKTADGQSINFHAFYYDKYLVEMKRSDRKLETEWFSRQINDISAAVRNVEEALRYGKYADTIHFYL